MIELENEICCSGKVYIYGAGEYGKVMAAYLLHIGMLGKLEAFIVTNPGKEEKLFGKPVVYWSDIQSCLDGSGLIIVAVAEDKQPEILGILGEVGDVHVFCLADRSYVYMRNTLKGIPEVSSYVSEILYGLNFDRLISESSWLKKKDFSPGGMAVCSQYLYLLYKILDSGKFHSLLDLGMGQTSKMISQYVESHSGTEHIVVEADREWANFFMEANGMTRSRVELMEYEIRMVEGVQVRAFSGFAERLQNERFDYISIDAPLGGGKYSRVDILELLPGCLAESWVIMVDDIGREGERNTLEKIRDILSVNKNSYVERRYAGVEKEFAVFTSYDRRFFATV